VISILHHIPLLKNIRFNDTAVGGFLTELHAECFPAGAEEKRREERREEYVNYGIGLVVTQARFKRLAVVAVTAELLS